MLRRDVYEHLLYAWAITHIGTAKVNTHLLSLWEIAHCLARARHQTPHRTADHRHIRRSRPVYAGYASSRAAVSSSVTSPLTSPRSSAARMASTLFSPRAAAT